MNTGPEEAEKEDERDDVPRGVREMWRECSVAEEGERGDRPPAVEADCGDRGCSGNSRELLEDAGEEEDAEAAVCGSGTRFDCV